MNRHCIYLGLFVLAISLSWSGHSHAGQTRAFPFWYNYATSECRTRGGGSNDYFEYYAAQWVTAMYNAGWTTYTFDNKTYSKELTDSSKCSWGLDHDYENLDDGDATMLFTHGNYQDDYFYWLLGTNSGNGATEPCLNDNCTCLASSHDMQLGDNDAEFVHSFACQSANWDGISTSTGREFLHRRLHQYGGFHGEYVLGDFLLEQGRVYSFAEDANVSSVAWSWIDNFHRKVTTANEYNCPVSVIHGNDAMHAASRREYEQYDSGYSDPSSSYTLLLYISNCDPYHDDPIPQ